MRSLEEAGGCPVEFRILGPLEVVEDAEPLDVGPHKQRSLLAILLLHANRVVTTDHLLEELWGDDADGKENALWVYVSRLRAVLEPDREKGAHPQVLVTRDHGYQLVVDPESIDSHRFELTVEEARSLVKDEPSTASSMLRDALATWRGSALQDFAYDDFAQPEIVRLEELRLGALEDAVEADLRAGKSGELIGELEQLHERHPMRERPVGQLMLALYRAGRSADALRAFERFRRTIGEELGIDPSPELCRLEEQVLLHDSRLQPRRPTLKPVAVSGPAANPFRGLRPFSEDDAGDFFGRDRLIAEVVRRIDEDDRLIAMVGPSGSGKSSAVRAGLIPSIRKGAVAGSDHWLIAQMLPGSDPFIELEAALLRSTIDAPDSLMETLQAEDGSGLLRAALRLLPTEGSRFLLVVDQFEELFTLVEDEAERMRFLDHLVGAVDDTYGRVVVIVTLRADFYGRPLEHSDFGTRMGTGVVNVVPLTSDELEDAALEPARRSGVTLEPALLAELISDVLGQPGALPMFQYTLTELFDRRVGDVLTIDTYRAIGGVQGALTKSAEELFEQLAPAEREVVKQLFLRLVTIAEHDEWSRRRVHAAELIALDVDVVTLQTVIESFTKRRLLSLDRDQVTGNATVEVAHEALLSGWERLREWIEQNREDLVRHRELATAADRWEASGRDGDYLYMGGRLDSAQQWSLETAITLTDGEREFLDAGLDRRREEEDRERQRVEQQQRLERTTRWRTRGMVTAVVVLAAVVGGVLWAVLAGRGPQVALVYRGPDAGPVQELTLQGWEQTQREFDFREATVVPLIDDEEHVRDLAEAGYDLIITNLFDRGGAVHEVAEDFADTHFVVLDGDGDPNTNVTGVDFVRKGGAFLMGMAAALQSETDRIGFIGGFQQPSTEERRAAFAAGARSINPDIVVDAVYLGPYSDGFISPFQDYDLARATAAEMYRSGVDVIHHSAGQGVAIADAAAQLRDETGRELWVIGSEIDERRAAQGDSPDQFLTSLWKRWDRVVVDAVRLYLADNLPAGTLQVDLADGFLDYAREDSALTPGQITRLEEAKADIIAGRIDPPVAPREPPRWTRDPVLTVNLTFDGRSCSVDRRSADLITGDVVTINIENVSDTVLASAIFKLDEDDLDRFDWEHVPVQTSTPPGGRNAIAMRLITGSFTADCFVFDEDGDPEPAAPGATFAATFETDCLGPAVESDNPADVVHALNVASNNRDPGAVCSLFAQDGAMMADRITLKDDDRWRLRSSVSDIVVSGSMVEWTVQFTTSTRSPLRLCLRAEVSGGKILWLEPRDCE